MRDQHEPRDEFVERLQSTIGQEVRRRNSLTESRGWTPRWQMRAAAGMAALVIVSMAIGGAVVALAYQVQDNERRDLLSTVYLRQLDVAERRLMNAQAELQNARQRVATGLGNQSIVLEARVKLVEAETALKVVNLQLEEVRLTAREPLSEVTSPLVSGRDFVTERWKAELNVPLAALELEKLRLSEVMQRVEIGTASPIDAGTVHARVVELEAGILAFKSKIDIRQRFLKGQITAPMADLSVIEATIEHRRKPLMVKIELAEKEAEQAATRFNVGTATPVEKSEALVRLLQARTDVAQLDLELALVRRKIDQLKGK